MHKIYQRLILIVFSLFLINVTFAQSLYWVGGSGNFNDPKHWSLQSGGSSAFLIPDIHTDVVFDDNSGEGYFSVNFDKNNSVRNLTAKSTMNVVKFVGNQLGVVYISEGIQLSPLVKFESQAEMIFSSTSFKSNLIEFGLSVLNCNLYFNDGTYNFRSISLKDENSIHFGKGTYNFSEMVLVTGNLISNNPSAKFNFNKSYFKATNNFKIDENTNVTSNKLYVVANKNSAAKFIAPSTLKGQATNTFVNYVMPICNLTISATPACLGPCTGVLTISFSPTCLDPPYNVVVNNPACPATAGTLSANNVTSLSTVFVYQALNACECTLQNYQVLVFDNSSNFVSQNVNFIQNPALVTNINTLPTCATACNGKMTGNIFGTPPFTVAVTPSGTIAPSNFTTNLTYTINNMCAGVYTFNVTDANNCVTIVTKTLTAPPPVLPNAVTASLACNSICNGSVSVSPTGGTAGYTVTFSPGGTFTVPAAGTASLTGLCAGAISATITDAQSCSVTTNFNVTQPTSITATQTQTNLTCFNNCIGAASVALSGGTPPYSYTWNPGPGNTAGITGLCSGTQTVSYTDANSCTGTRTYNITSPPAITLTLTRTNVVCFNACNGSATAQATGGTGAITFTWTGPPPFTTSNTAVISNLCPGTYTVNAKDANNCTVTQTISITQPPALTLTITKTDNTCFSSCAGSATAVVSGGNGAPYVFAWTSATVTGANTAFASGMCAGNYTCAVTDASACPISSVITITQPTSITPNVTSASVTCNAACNGSINAAPTGGTGGPYTFTLVTPTSATLVGAPPYTNLCAGVYTLSVRDASSCVVSQTINITQPNPLVPSITANTVTCFNACNGSLAGSVLGGTPGYTLMWNTPTGTVAGGNLVNQCAGNYTFYVTDANSCSVSATFSLTQPSDITATLNVTNPTCNGGTNGSIGVVLAGGSPGYTLNWSSGSGNPNTGLGAGTYTLIVVDSKGCNKTFTAAVVAPPALSLTINTSSLSCAGVVPCDGSATVTASGGTGPYTYQFNTIPATINATGIVSGLCAGGYIVSVTDNNGCPISQAFNILQPTVLTAAITGSVPTCNVCTGASTVTVGGGTPSYTVNWTNSVSVVVATGTNAANLCVGTYTANVVDSRGCTATASVNIVNTVSVTVVTGGSSILCNSACNASATANALGGTLPYSFTWSPTAPTQTTQSATGLCAGTYTVFVQDQLGCSNTGTITFTQPTSVTVNSSQTNIPCFGGNSGAITTTVSGGVGPYTYSWSPGGQTTSSVTNLGAGVYTLNLHDLNNCSQILTFTIAQNPSLTASFTSTNPSGCILANGSICATPSGGSGSGYTFTWTPAGTGGANNACNVGLGAGNYSVIIQDGAGCTTTLATTLSNPAGPTVAVTPFTVTCFGANNGSATAVASGSGPFSFTWSPASTSVVAGATTTATGLGSGNYNITVSDNNGCITSQSLNITQPTSVTITSNVSNALCNSTCNGSITTNVLGGTPGYTYSWLPAPSITVGQGTGTVSSLCAGNYTLNLTDANGCANTRTFVINAPSSLTVTSTQTNVTCNSFSTAAISLTIAGGSPGYSFTWSPVASNNSSVSNLPIGTYTVVIADVNNCNTTRTFTITQPTALGHTVTTTNNACNALCNGTASQVVTGGTPTYSFSWSSSAATTQSLGALCAGNYTANVVDGNGCVSSRTFVITQPTAISVTATPSHPKCNAACNGSITTNVGGGNGGYSYAWSPTGVGANPTGLCAGIYTLTVTDASLCTGNAVVTLTNPPLAQANVTFTNPLCNANCNGIAVSNPINVTAPISYTWSPTGPPTQTTQSATGLCAGTYSVFISDANGCTDVQQVTLTNPPSLTVNPSILPATCGNSNGTISIGISGGTPTYAVNWFAPVSSTNTLVTNLAAGIYTVSVADANGCTNTITIPMSNANGPSSAIITQTNVNCNAQCTGAASIGVVTGGTPGYTLSWVVPPSTSSVNPQANLCAGTYTAQIRDANNCLLFQSITITQPPAIDDNEIVTNALCSGVCTGSIVVNPTGGSGLYAYQWSSSPSTVNTATGLCVGVHTATITDVLLGCTFTATYTINGTINLTSAIASTSNQCFGNCNGSSTVTSTGGGTPPYTYNWSNSQNGIVATNLCNGTYSLIITDNNGCNNTFTTSITSPNAIALLPAITQPSCGLCNGSSTITASGGTSPYTYSWTTSGTGTVEANLCAGLYQVLVTDNNGCTQLTNIPVSNSSGITGETFNVQNELCFNDCNGSVTVTPIGGNLPISFNWINPASTNSVITNLCGGTYFVQMSDAQGCIRTSSVAVNSATNIVITPTVFAPSCATNNGTVMVNVTGGTGTYTYNWSPAGNTATLNNVGAGIYTVTVTDGVCTKTAAVTVNNVTSPVILSTKADNGCIGLPCIGSVAITPTLGTPGYTVNWSNGNTTNTVTNLCGGVISVTVTDAAGCSAVQSFTIDQNPALNLSLPAVAQLDCNNDCDASITLVPSGGTLPYTITWVPSTTVTPSNPLNNLCAGSYTGIVTDSKGCVATTSIDILNPAAYSLTANVVNATCNSANDGAATTTVSGGTPTYTFSWTGPATFTTQNISNVTPGTYTFSIIDSKGCQKDTTIVIIPSFTVLADAGRDTSFCTNNAILLNGNNSVNALNYEWSLAPVSASIANTSTTMVMPPIGTNTYVLLVTSSVAICFDYDTVIVNTNPLPLVNAGPTYSMPLFSSTVIGGSPTSATGVTYTWIPSGTLSNPNIPNPTASNTINTTYTVFVTDANGCVSSSTVDILIFPEIKIPNGFSPNADGRNDSWIIDNIQQFPESRVEVYNRWGELLFSSPPGYPTPFDGKYKGKDLPVGTYYYIINLNHVAYPDAYTGPLTIFR